MNSKQEVISHGHLQVIGGRGNRRWRAFWWDADGKHSRVLGPAWAQNSGKKTARGAVVWHAADGPKPDPSYLTPKEARAELRRLLEHDVAKRPTPRSASGKPVTFADAAEAWLRHGERKRNLKRSTLKDYRQALDAYLLPPPHEQATPATRYGRAPFAARPLRELRADDHQQLLARDSEVRGWYERLPYGRTMSMPTSTLSELRTARSSHPRSVWTTRDLACGQLRQLGSAPARLRNARRGCKGEGSAARQRAAG